MKIKLTLPGTVRTKKNSRQISLLPSKHQTGIFTSRRGRLIQAMAFPRPGKAYLQWETIARIEARQQLPKGFILLKNSIGINAQIFYKGSKPDIQGAFEAIADCLQGVVYENDKQIDHWDNSRMIHDLKNPRTEVTIYEIESKECDAL